MNRISLENNFKKFEEFITSNEDYSDVLISTLQNWKFKNRRFSSFNKIIRKITNDLKKIYDERFIEGFQNSHFTDFEKSLLNSIFRFVQRVLVFTPESNLLPEKLLYIKYALCFDFEISIQAFKVISLYDNTNVINKDSEVYGEIFARLVNMPSINFKKFHYAQNVKDINSEEFLEDDDIFEFFRINKVNTNIYNTYIELNRRICNNNEILITMKRIYALLSLSSNVTNKNISEIINKEFSLKEINFIKKNLKVGDNTHSLTINNQLSFFAFQELKFCFDSFINYIVSLNFDKKIILDLLDFNDKEDYLKKSLELTESSNFENIKIYSVFEELLVNCKNEEIGFNPKIHFNVQYDNPDLEFKYYTLIFNYLLNNNWDFERFINLEHFLEILNNFDKFFIRKDIFVLKLIFKIINEVYIKGSAYFEPFEDSKYLQKCVQLIYEKNSIYSNHCINTINYFMNNDPLSIKKIKKQGLDNIFKNFLWHENNIKSLISLFDAISLDKDTRIEFVEKKELTQFFSLIFNRSDAYVVDIWKEINRNLSILILHHPEYKNEALNIVKKNFKFFSKSKNIDEKTNINEINFFKFVTSLYFDVDKIIDDEFLEYLELIYLKSISTDKYWVESYFKMLCCEIFDLNDRSLILEHFTFKLATCIFQVIEKDVDTSEYLILEKYVFFMCQMIHEGYFLSCAELRIINICFYFLLNLLPIVIKHNFSPTIGTKTILDLLDIRNELLASDCNILQLLCIECQFFYIKLIYGDESSKSCNWFKFFLNLLYPIDEIIHTDEPKRIKNNEEICTSEIRLLIKNKNIDKLHEFGEYLVINKVSTKLIQKNSKFLIDIIEYNPSKLNRYNTRLFLDWIVLNNLIIAENLWSNDQLFIIISKFNLRMLDFKEPCTKMRIFNFLLKFNQDDKTYSLINSLIGKNDNFDIKEERQICDYFINFCKKKSYINYRKIFKDDKFLKNVLEYQDYKIFIINDHVDNFDVISYLINYQFTLSKDFINLVIYFLKYITYNSINFDLKKLQTIFYTKDTKFSSFEVKTFLENFKIILKNREIIKRKKIILLIIFLKYCKSIYYKIPKKFYKRIVKFTTKMISLKNKEATDLLIKSLFHHLLIDMYDIYNVKASHICSYSKFIDSHYLLGYRDINALRKYFKAFKSKIESDNILLIEKKVTDLSNLQRYIFALCIECSKKNIFMLNIIHEILVNDSRYVDFITDDYLEFIVKEFISIINLEEKIAAESEYFIAIDFLAYFIKSKKYEILYNILKINLLEVKNQKIYNYLVVLFAAMDYIKIINCSIERFHNDDTSLVVAEKLMKSGIAEIIFSILVNYKESNFLLSNNKSIISYKLIYERLSIISWNRIKDTNKIPYIYAFLSTVYGKYYDDILIDSEESDDYWSNESNSYFTEEEEDPYNEIENITFVNSSSDTDDYDSYEDKYERESLKVYNTLFTTLYLSEVEVKHIEDNNMYKFIDMISNIFKKEFNIDNLYNHIIDEKNYVDEGEDTFNENILNESEIDFESEEASNYYDEEYDTDDELYDEGLIGENDDDDDESSIGEENGVKPDKSVEEINNMNIDNLKDYLNIWYEERKMYSLNYKPIDKEFYNRLSDSVKHTINELELKLKDDYFKYAPNYETSVDFSKEERELPENIEMYADIEIFKNFFGRYLTKDYSFQLNFNEFLEVAFYNLEYKKQIIEILMSKFLETEIVGDQILELYKCLEIFKVSNTLSKKEYQENICFVKKLVVLAKFEKLNEICLYLLSKIEIKKDIIDNECLEEFGEICKLPISKKTKKYFFIFCKSNLEDHSLFVLIINLLRQSLDIFKDKNMLIRYLTIISDLSILLFKSYEKNYSLNFEQCLKKLDLEKRKIQYFDFMYLYDQKSFDTTENILIDNQIYYLLDKLLELVNYDSDVFIVITLYSLYEDFINYLIFFDTINKEHIIEKYRTKRICLENNILKNPKIVLGIISNNGNIVPFVSKFNVLSFIHKHKYLKEKLDNLNYYVDGSFIITVRRNSVLEDSFFQIMNKSSKELKTKRIQINFSGEKGLDFGGLTKEWLELIIKEAVNPDLGLFVYSSDKHTTVHPYINSKINSDHLLYYKFIGRLLAKVILEGYNLGIYFDKSVYKYLLSKKCSLQDLEEIDYQYYNSLIWIRDNNIENILNLTFSYENNELGTCQIDDLIPDGKNIPVKDSNKNNYIDLVVQRKLTKNVELQLNAIKNGLYELIDEDYISIFTENEFELLICGIPEINVEDWQNNTLYHGYTKNSRNIIWFWKAVSGFTPDEKAKLLQFCTGSTRVPFDGFKNLQGNNGIQKFSIHKISSTNSRLPSAHTCFNQLDLPEYTNYENLRKNVIYAINECNEGFSII